MFRSTQVYLYDTLVENWTEMPSMSVGRFGAHCGLATDAFGNGVVVAAGGSDGSRTDHVEVFNLTTKEWREGSYIGFDRRQSTRTIALH